MIAAAMLSQETKHLWNEVLSLNTTSSKPAVELSNECIAEVERQAREWGETFVFLRERTLLSTFMP